MNNSIKTIVESLFDDDMVSLIDSGENECNDKIYDLYNIIKNTWDRIPLNVKTYDNGLKDFETSVIKKYASLDDLLQDTKTNPINISYIKISEYLGTIEPFIYIFDLLMLWNVKVSFGYICIELGTDNHISVKDLIDFNKYKDIFIILSFGIVHGALKDMEGVPNYILKEMCFSYIKCIDSFKGFLYTNYLQYEFYNSSLPEDWTYFPDIVQNISMTISDIDDIKEYKFEEKKEYIPGLLKKYLRNFKNISGNLQFKVNMNNPNKYKGFMGCYIVSPIWYKGIRKIARDYIAGCLKKQFKSGEYISMKNKLCSLWKEYKEE